LNVFSAGNQSFNSGLFPHTIFWFSPNESNNRQARPSDVGGHSLLANSFAIELPLRSPFLVILVSFKNCPRTLCWFLSPSRSAPKPLLGALLSVRDRLSFALCLGPMKSFLRRFPRKLCFFKKVALRLPNESPRRSTSAPCDYSPALPSQAGTPSNRSRLRESVLDRLF